MAYFRCGGNKPKEMVIKGARDDSSLWTPPSVKFDLTIPCEDYSKLDVDSYGATSSCYIYGILEDGTQEVISNENKGTKQTYNIANYSSVRFYAVNSGTNTIFVNGFYGDIRFYN